MNTIVSNLVSVTNLSGVYGSAPEDFGSSFTTGNFDIHIDKLITTSYGGLPSATENASSLFVNIREFANDTESTENGCFSGTLLGTSDKGKNTVVANNLYPIITFHFSADILLRANTKYVFQFGKDVTGSLPGAFYTRLNAGYTGGRSYAINNLNPSLDQDVSFEIHARKPLSDEQTGLILMWNARQLQQKPRLPGNMLSLYFN